MAITTHERNVDARNKYIQSKGIKCFVCGFDFEKTYGELGKGFIHVHHVNPISNKDGRYEINIEKDLFPVCLIVMQCYTEEKNQYYPLKNLNK